MANKEKSFYYEKSPHQKRWGAYRERQQERRMRNEKRELQAEHRERIHSGRKRAGTALANAFAVILAFILIMTFVGGGTALARGIREYKEIIGVTAYNSSTKTNEPVYLHSFRFHSSDGFFEAFESSFSVLKKYTRFFTFLGEKVVGTTYYLVPLYNGTHEAFPIGSGKISWDNRDFIVIQDYGLFNTKFDVYFSNYDNISTYSCDGNYVYLYDYNDNLIYTFNFYSGEGEGYIEGLTLGFLPAYRFHYFNDIISAGQLWVDDCFAFVGQ